MCHPRRWNLATSLVELEMVTYAKISPTMVNPRGTAWNAEEEEEEDFVCGKFLMDHFFG